MSAGTVAGWPVMQRVDEDGERERRNQESGRVNVKKCC